MIVLVMVAFYYWMCRSDVSVIPFRMCNHSFWPLWIFDLSLPVGDKFFKLDDKWNRQLVIGLRYR